MKLLATILIAVLVSSTHATSATLFEDHFTADSQSDYTLGCYGNDSANWQFTGGVLRGSSTSYGGQCYALVGDPTWQIASVSCRMNGVSGIDKGINIHNALGHLAVNLRSSPYNDMMVTNGHAGGFITVALPHSNGQWMDVEIRIVGADMQVYVNGSLIVTRTIAPDVLAASFNDARLWVYNHTVTDYDDFRVEGAGVVPAETANWGSLKSVYR